MYTFPLVNDQFEGLLILISVNHLKKRPNLGTDCGDIVPGVK
jgi:hypothetical protein